MNAQSHQLIAVLDFGSQYGQLIARRVRENHVYCEILRHDVTAEELRQRNPKGIILSGGPASVYQESAPRCDARIFDLGVPVLGICYGLQIAAKILGGSVSRARAREYGKTQCTIVKPNELFAGLPQQLVVWMSHGDQVEHISGGFEALARTENCPYAAVRHTSRPFYGVQFHPEVTHTPLGKEILHNFLYRICQVSGDWTMGAYIEEAVLQLRAEIGESHAVCAVSGGVDSTVVAKLLARAIGSRAHCVFVDNGLLRKGEAGEVADRLRNSLECDIRVVDASQRFLAALKGVTDPEAKRRIIGHTFIAVFEEEARSLPNPDFLVQGTLYPDLIESRSPFGAPSATIKTHHNVGGLPEQLRFRIVEPLRFLFKDEARAVARELGFDETLVRRHPFPGPGLAVRVVGEVTAQRLALLREADAIFIGELQRSGLYNSVAQAFAVFLPISSVGVMGDERTYENVVALRAVVTEDYMTADWARLPYDFLAQVANRIINEVRGINRVVYDISSKPPSTIEWE